MDDDDDDGAPLSYNYANEVYSHMYIERERFYAMFASLLYTYLSVEISAEGRKKKKTPEIGEYLSKTGRVRSMT